MYAIPKGVRAISFDIWKTLLVGNKAFTQPRMQLIFGLLGYQNFDITHVCNVYREASRHFDKLSEQTGLDYGMADRLQIVFGTLGIAESVPDEQTLAMIQDQVAAMRCRPEYIPSFTEPDLPATLEALRNQGYTLGLLSNTGIDNQQVMEPVLTRRGIWDLFEVTLFSNTDGRAKPNPGLFHRMAKEFGVEPHQVLHIGDNVNADYRAIEAGMHAVVYAPKGKEEYPFITSMKELQSKT